jgi:hypothetical protein
MVFLAFLPGLDDAFQPPKAAVSRVVGLATLAAFLCDVSDLRAVDRAALQTVGAARHTGREGTS